MGNILDYLDWRGDIPFSVDPFNEIDGLVLAQTAYTGLDGLIREDEVLPAWEAARRFFEKYDRTQVKEDHGIHKDGPFLLEKLGESKRFSGLCVSNYINHIDMEAEAQISAMVLSCPDFTFVSYRGTDNTLVGWKEDFKLSYERQTQGQLEAVIYLNRVAGNVKNTLYVGGHSKGGNFALYASAFGRESIRERIRKIFSFDGPGFVKEITDGAKYRSVLPKVVSIVPESTLVSTLFTSRLKHKIVTSSVEGLPQHDATTWQVVRNHFVEAEDRTSESYLMDDTVTSWLEGLSRAERAEFTDVVFDTLSSSGATTINEVTEGRMNKIWGIVRSANSLPKEKRREFTDMVRLLIKSGQEAYRPTGWDRLMQKK